MPDEGQGEGGWESRGWPWDVINRARGRRGNGDVIAGQVGDEAQGVAIGRNIIQIGTVVLPTLPVLAGLLLAVFGSALALWLY
jgi:hypothetical protein